MADPETDPRLSLAYEAAVNLLSIQNGTLESLRNRATGLLSVAALVTSFSTGLGLLNRDPAKGPVFPDWASLTLLVILICVGLLVMVVLWPIRDWGYAVHPGIILNKIEDGDTEDSIRQSITSQAVLAAFTNKKGIDARSFCYRLGVILLLIEVVVLVAALLLQ